MKKEINILKTTIIVMVIITIIAGIFYLIAKYDTSGLSGVKVEKKEILSEKDRREKESKEYTEQQENDPEYIARELEQNDMRAYEEILRTILDEEKMLSERIERESEIEREHNLELEEEFGEIPEREKESIISEMILSSDLKNIYVPFPKGPKYDHQIIESNEIFTKWENEAKETLFTDSENLKFFENLRLEFDEEFFENNKLALVYTEIQVENPRYSDLDHKDYDVLQKDGGVEIRFAQQTNFKSEFEDSELSNVATLTVCYLVPIGSDITQIKVYES